MIPAAVSEIAKRITITADSLIATLDGEEVTADTASGLSGQLGALMYTRIHAGTPKGDSDLAPRRARDFAAEELIAVHTPHQETIVTATVASEPVHNTQVVTLGGVRIRVSADKVIQRDGETVKLAFPSHRPALSTGFYLVESSAENKVSPGLLRLYLHCEDLDSALVTWKTVLTHLEERKAVYRAKVLSAALAYPRRDAIVIYLPPQSWQYARTIADLAPELALSEQVSPITHRLAPGISAAWEPDDSRPHMQRLSFGQHRMNIIAAALVGQALGDNGITPDEAVYEAFIDNGIDPTSPARNLSSPPLTELAMF
ncbi:T3SS effector HopA1 family protein [Streptomyces sp. ISL-11]|uniref:T3SS effector HopA1 family protein n=1 Tax=Streptomyces sp. ISL-11 TaxID=2819174 RepID=UPI001BEBA292|nr:T3SS effector HopA1 family protein [Streptomyces sp. ISL-11]MBT2386683.1 hypothetical protein [Streptomyces sp. ISL-11]